MFLVFKMDRQTNHLFVFMCNAAPKSDANMISLYDANPLKPPKVTLNYLQDQKDLKTLRSAIDYVRKIFNTDAIKRHGRVTELWPGLNETDLSAYIRNTRFPAYHFS
jgi:choline dehydrogenase-like flavoprotein